MAVVEGRQEITDYTAQNYEMSKDELSHRHSEQYVLTLVLVVTDIRTLAADVLIHSCMSVILIISPTPKLTSKVCRDIRNMYLNTLHNYAKITLDFLDLTTRTLPLPN